MNEPEIDNICFIDELTLHVHRNWTQTLYGVVMNSAGPMRRHVAKLTTRPPMIRYRGIFCKCEYVCIERRLIVTQMINKMHDEKLWPSLLMFKTAGFTRKGRHTDLCTSHW